MTMTITKIFLIVIVMVMVAATIGGFFAGARAQTEGPQFMITWQSRTYTPPGFEGKILPTANSTIMVSFELIDGGSPANLSNQTVYWYINNNFLQGGKGLQHVEFTAPDVAGGTLDLRVEVPNYKQGAQLKTVEIPIVTPKAVIDAPFPNDQFSTSPIQLTGLPYFFNVRDISPLNFSWSINGVAPSGTENPNVLTIRLNQNAPAGSLLDITFNVQNKNNTLEGASKNINLMYRP